MMHQINLLYTLSKQQSQLKQDRTLTDALYFLFLMQLLPFFLDWLPKYYHRGRDEIIDLKISIYLSGIFFAYLISHTKTMHLDLNLPQSTVVEKIVHISKVYKYLEAPYYDFSKNTYIKS